MPSISVVVVAVCLSRSFFASFCFFVGVGDGVGRDYSVGEDFGRGVGGDTSSPYISVVVVAVCLFSRCCIFVVLLLGVGYGLDRGFGGEDYALHCG